MKITDALLGEHGLFYALFEQIEQSIAGAGEDLPALTRALAGLLGSHAILEEEHLFPALQPQVGEMGPLAVMEMEHRQIEGLLESILGTTDIDTLKGETRALLDITTEHFAKEEGVLFHMAEQFLDESLLHQLGDAWAKARGVNLDAMGCAA